MEIKPLLVSSLLLVTSCAHSKTQNKCEFSAHSINSAGTVSKVSFLNQSHVEKLNFDYQQAGIPGLEVQLTKEGQKIAAAYTQAHLNEQIALFCGQREVSRPKIYTPAFNGGFVIFPRPASDP